MTIQIINDEYLTGHDEKVMYVNGVESLFKHIPDGQHENRLETLTNQIQYQRGVEQNLSDQRARLIKDIVEQKKLSVIQCADIMKVSRQRVYKIIESVDNKLEEE